MKVRYIQNLVIHWFNIFIENLLYAKDRMNKKVGLWKVKNSNIQVKPMFRKILRIIKGAFPN